MNGRDAERVEANEPHSRVSIAVESTLACQRRLFQLEEGAHFLNCAYLGPLPRSVAEAGMEGIRRKCSPTPFPSEEFFTDCGRARERFGRLVNAPPERIALAPSASYGIEVAARNLPLEPGQNVVVLGEQFPSNVYAWRRQAAAHGCDVRTVDRPGPPPSAALWNERLLEAIGPDTAVVALPHCHWTDGTRIDLEAVGVRAREVGAALVIDGSQSIGAVPFDVEHIRPDALITVGYKWLLGPYSTAFGYYGARFDDGAPLEETWISRRGSEDFQGLVDYTDEYREGAARYDVGQTSNFILIPMLIEALDLILAWSPANILEYCRGLLAGLADELRVRGWAIEDDEWRTGNILGVRLPAGCDLAEMDARLAEARVYASLRGDALRVSPNVYNDASDVEALRRVLATVS
ncbi:aminotransferase class V-fold PLP-dependent enzyme [Candidatus Palauibacter sp.]|uniref:aminotransferase class V-fold PLP-dependent enzyme n=1 Tax=Candidatus Palauibacter sp. TaxID=3101350 RepID=UPI003B5A2285